MEPVSPCRLPSQASAHLTFRIHRRYTRDGCQCLSGWWVYCTLSYRCTIDSCRWWKNLNVRTQLQGALARCTEASEAENDCRSLYVTKVRRLSVRCPGGRVEVKWAGAEEDPGVWTALDLTPLAFYVCLRPVLRPAQGTDLRSCKSGRETVSMWSS